VDYITDTIGYDFGKDKVVDWIIGSLCALKNAKNFARQRLPRGHELQIQLARA
jgi:hypothetical protein